MTARPLVLGHRGASAVAPENTIAAFARARELGADGVELDVRRSADGVLTLNHDPDVEGAGRVAQMTLAELRTARPDVATLDEALTECRGLVINVEVKCLRWEPDADTDGSVMRATMDALQSTVDAESKIIVSSFDLPAVDLAHEYAPEATTAWLTHGMEVGKGVALAAEHGHAWLNPDVTSALAGGRDAIDQAHAAGLLVSVWTVDDPDHARALADAGVDCIISNVPDAVIAALS